VATFNVHVEGVDPAWVMIYPEQVNLNERQKATVNISITPPRDPSSAAGAHHFAVVVTSPNYPGRRSLHGATLNINPYYEFAVGDLSPKQQSISWRHRSAETVLPIANKGNSEAPFRIEAEDDERACSFEFQVPGESTTLARQAELRLPAQETFAIPIEVTPRSRSLFGLRSRRYSFTVTVNMLAEQHMPRSIIGQLRSKPLIGPGLLALILLFFAVLVVIIFRPRVYQFGVDDLDVNEVSIMAGTPIALQWRASPFSSLKIDQGIGSVERGQGQKEIVPMEEAIYRLRADNLLGQLLPISFGDEERSVLVEVIPVRPKIVKFDVLNDQIGRAHV